MNPFGVHHEPLSKAYKNIAGRIDRASTAFFKDRKMAGHKTMNAKLRLHALDSRWISGTAGRGEKIKGREHKKAAQGMYDAIGREGRAKKVLP